MGTDLAPGEWSRASVAVPRRWRQMCGRAEQIGRAELHVHSFWSDGAQGPDTIARAAVGRAQVIAIIDHDAWYLGSAVTRFGGRHADPLGRALALGRTRAHGGWSWSADTLSRHLCIQTRSLIRFLMLRGRRRRMASVS